VYGVENLNDKVLGNYLVEKGKSVNLNRKKYFGVRLSEKFSCPMKTTKIGDIANSTSGRSTFVVIGLARNSERKCRIVAN
jgi:hypothetical protein